MAGAEGFGDPPGFGLGGADRQARGDAGAEMACGREVGVAEECHPLVAFGEEVCKPFRLLFGSRRRVAEGREHAAADRPLAGVVGMDGIGDEGVGGILFTLGVEEGLHRRVGVDHRPAIGPLREKPSRVFLEHPLVVGVTGGVIRAGTAVVERRREVDDLRPCLLNFVVELFDPGLVGGETGVVERQIDAAVHPVAGDDEIGLHHREDACETLMDIGTGKLAAGMPLLREPGAGLAREPDGDHIARQPLGLHPGRERRHPATVVGDAVAENADPLCGREHLERAGRRFRGRLGGPGYAERGDARNGQSNKQRSHWGAAAPTDRSKHQRIPRKRTASHRWQAADDMARSAGPAAPEGRQGRGTGASGYFASGVAPSRIANRWLLLAM